MMNPKQHKERLKDQLYYAAEIKHDNRRPEDKWYDNSDKIADKAIDEFVEAFVGDLTAECVRLSVKGEGEDTCLEVEGADLPKMYFKSEQQINEFAAVCKEMLKTLKEKL